MFEGITSEAFIKGCSAIGAGDLDLPVMLRHPDLLFAAGAYEIHIASVRTESEYALYGIQKCVVSVVLPDTLFPLRGKDPEVFPYEQPPCKNKNRSVHIFVGYKGRCNQNYKSEYQDQSSEAVHAVSAGHKASQAVPKSVKKAVFPHKKIASV